MEFLLELRIHRGHSVSTMHIWTSFEPVDAWRLVPVNFVQAILSKIHA